MASRDKIRAWMAQELQTQPEIYQDETGEWDPASLADTADGHFGVSDPYTPTPVWLLELAQDVLPAPPTPAAAPHA